MDNFVRKRRLPATLPSWSLASSFWGMPAALFADLGATVTAHQRKPVLGVQFHPELERTPGRKGGILNDIYQACAGADTNKAVGVMGDTRIRGYIVIFHAVTRSDVLSAESYEFPFGLLKAIARRIVDQVDGVSRVTYYLSLKTT
ncbi:hypothetical protein E4U43_004639 [Claviceps pusilla]|uniref:GMP synthase C-terminal domain-containing protein n=1 Tax=Claviceps pusilla TaxID=123648 RepID=A0A9P7N340_9HYPO|nr:hypothetical protein E4U43_004639 [Claviceps pusilla]